MTGSTHGITFMISPPRNAPSNFSNNPPPPGAAGFSSSAAACPPAAATNQPSRAPPAFCTATTPRHGRFGAPPFETGKEIVRAPLAATGPVVG